MKLTIFLLCGLLVTTVFAKTSKSDKKYKKIDKEFVENLQNNNEINDQTTESEIIKKSSDFNENVPLSSRTKRGSHHRIIHLIQPGQKIRKYKSKKFKTNNQMQSDAANQETYPEDISHYNTEAVEKGDTHFHYHDKNKPMEKSYEIQASSSNNDDSYQTEDGGKYEEHKEKIKIKHHHHHHHHNHVKTVIKKVPEPYPVEKIVHVPKPYAVEKIVEKPVHIEKRVPYAVEKIVHVPVEKIVEKMIHVPVEKIIHVPKPYPVEKIVHVPVEKLVEKYISVPKPYPVEKIVHVPVEKIVEKVVHVPKPYPVEKIVEKVVEVPKPYPVIKHVPYQVKVPVHIPKPYPVEKKVPVPIAIEKKIPVPFKVEVEKKVPIFIHNDQPNSSEYKYEKPIADSHSYENDKDYESADTNHHQIHAVQQPTSHQYYNHETSKIPNNLQKQINSGSFKNVLQQQQFHNFGGYFGDMSQQYYHNPQSSYQHHHHSQGSYSKQDSEQNTSESVEQSISVLPSNSNEVQNSNFQINVPDDYAPQKPQAQALKQELNSAYNPNYPVHFQLIQLQPFDIQAQYQQNPKTILR